MQKAPSTSDRFHPEMPRIPGVNEKVSLPARWKLHRRACIAVPIVVFAMLFVGFVHLLRGKLASGSTAATQTTDYGSKVPRQMSAPVIHRNTAPVMLSDVAKPWAAKEFTFVNPTKHIDVPAIVIRLPGTSPDRSDAYWAFSLDAPYKTCKLEYVTDLGELASRYHYRAVHPMVAAACDGTIYDPLKMGTTPAGAWVRGEVVQGMGIRPPLSIEVRVQGRSILASRIE